MGEFQPEGIHLLGGLLSKARLDLYCGSTTVSNIDSNLLAKNKSIILGLSLGPAQINSQSSPSALEGEAVDSFSCSFWVVFCLLL